MEEAEKFEWASRPLINIHTHIFTGDHVPPYLAKTFVPWPFYYLINVNFIIAFFRSWHYGWLSTLRKIYKYKIIPIIYRCRLFIFRNIVLYSIMGLIGTCLFLNTLYFILDWFRVLPKPDDYSTWLAAVVQWVYTHAIWQNATLLFRLIIVSVLLAFFPAGRNLLLFVLKYFLKFIKMLPGPRTKELLNRYLLLGRFAFYNQQLSSFYKMIRQYPGGTASVVLPMDMEFMGAGRLKEKGLYHKQMEELAKIKSRRALKNLIYPFVFIDPRRIKKEGRAFFDWYEENGQVVLRDCFVKRYIEDEKFSGFKIYPALGYYPFDAQLLPLWKYAEEKQLPVLTHCIRGNVFYRGSKLKEWDTHPVFANPNSLNQGMILPEMTNIEFSNNFTHPMNYLCLLNRDLLKKALARADQPTKDLFAYSDTEAGLKIGLEKLKICFGHYGGDDEWSRFMESDRDNYSNALLRHPDEGVRFMLNSSQQFSPAKIQQMWRSLDWYSVITSLMLQYENIYSDISYIIHNPSIFPLLKQTLRNAEVKNKVLFGTDFYVVRNHKTEKSMLADLFSGLSDTEVILIAKKNPRAFLQNNITGELAI